MKVRDITIPKGMRCFHADLAAILGQDAAIVFERLRYLFEYEGNGRLLKGKRWLFNTYDHWQTSHFPWMSKRNIQRAFLLLEGRGMVESMQPDGASRKKYYRISDNAEEVELSHGAKLARCKVPTRHVPNTGIDVSGSSFSKEKGVPVPSTGPLEGFAKVREELSKPSILAPQAQSGTPNPLTRGVPLSPRGKPEKFEKPSQEEFQRFITFHEMEYIDAGIQYRRFSNPKAKLRWDNMVNWKTVTKRLYAKILKDKTREGK